MAVSALVSEASSLIERFLWDGERIAPHRGNRWCIPSGLVLTELREIMSFIMTPLVTSRLMCGSMIMIRMWLWLRRGRSMLICCLVTTTHLLSYLILPSYHLLLISLSDNRFRWIHMILLESDYLRLSSRHLGHTWSALKILLLLNLCPLLSGLAYLVLLVLS